MSLQRIRIDEINFGERFRKDMGDLQGLSASIKVLGLLHPVVVAKINGGFKLLAGGRRLRACRDNLGWSMIEANVVKFEKKIEHLLIEQHENEEREPLKDSEKVSIGKAIESELGERRGKPTKDIPVKCPELKGQETRDIAAESAGFPSTSAYERAKKVVDNGTPELVEAMDDGMVSKADAAAVADEPKREQRKAVKAVREGKARTAKAAVVRKPKPGKPVFDDRPIDQAIGKLIRLIDTRGNAVGKSARYNECVAAMESVTTSWRRWQKEST
jgi:ParB family chromosome partitioning protein